MLPWQRTRLQSYKRRNRATDTGERKQYLDHRLLPGRSSKAYIVQTQNTYYINTIDMYRVAQKKWTAVQSVNIRLRKLLLYSDLILVECTLCSKKHVTTSSTISWTRIVHYNSFWHTYFQECRPSIDVFIFPFHLFCAATLPWETVKT